MLLRTEDNNFFTNILKEFSPSVDTAIFMPPPPWVVKDCNYFPFLSLASSCPSSALSPRSSDASPNLVAKGQVNLPKKGPLQEAIFVTVSFISCDLHKHFFEAQEISDKKHKSCGVLRLKVENLPCSHTISSNYCDTDSIFIPTWSISTSAFWWFFWGKLITFLAHLLKYW